MKDKHLEKNCRNVMLLLLSQAHIPQSPYSKQQLSYDTSNITIKTSQRLSRELWTIQKRRRPSHASRICGIARLCFKRKKWHQFIRTCSFSRTWLWSWLVVRTYKYCAGSVLRRGHTERYVRQYAVSIYWQYDWPHSSVCSLRGVRSALCGQVKVKLSLCLTN
jgi:hypothetical protein